MKKFRGDEAGFSVIELVLIIVILAIVGVSGWLVYKNHNKTTTPTASSTSTNKTSTKSTTTNLYSGWKTYSTDGISFMYPPSWAIGSSSEVISASSIPYNPGAVPTNLPQYDNNLVFTLQLPIKNEVYSAPTSKPIGNGLILQNGITINNASNYCLIGYAYQGPNQSMPVTTTSNVAQIDFSPCDTVARTYSDYLSTSNNTMNFNVMIVSGNPMAENTPLSLNGSDYSNIKLIVESMRF